MINNITQLSKMMPRHNYKWHWLAAALFLSLTFNSKAQTLDWAKQLTSIDATSFGSAYNTSNAVVIDSVGNIYITGNIYDTVDFDPGPGLALLSNPSPDSSGVATISFIAKYDAEGNYIWVKKVLWGSYHIQGTDIALDAAGNVYVSGGVTGTGYFDTGLSTDSLTSSAYLAKYSNNGDLLWMNGMPASPSPTAFSCTTGRSGDVYVCGIFRDTINLNPSGAGGELINTATTTNYNVFIAKYSASGNYIWAKGLLGSGDISPYTGGGQLSLTVDTSAAEDKLYIAGWFRKGTIDFDPGPGLANLTSGNLESTFLAKYDSNGTYVWSNQVGSGTATSRVVNGSLAVDAQGNTYITGGMMGSADFDPTTNIATVSSGGLEDAFLAKYDPDGNYVWAEATQGSGSICTGTSIIIDQEGIIHLVGGYGFGTVDLDPGPSVAAFTPGGFTEMFIARYGRCGSLLSIASTQGNSNYPIVASWGGSTLSKDGKDIIITGAFGGTVDFDPAHEDTAMLTGPTDNLYNQHDMFLTKLHYGIDSGLTSFVDTAVCGDSFTLNGYTYTQSGSYEQWLPGIAQCDSFVVLNLSMGQIEEPVITVNGFVLGLTDTYDTYQWFKDGAPITGATAATYTVTENGSYEVAVTIGTQCAATSAPYVVTNATGITGIIGTGNQIAIYPNPTGNILNIKSPVAVNAILYSMEGRVIFQSDNTTAISLAGLADGVYMLKLKNKEGNVLLYEKVIKQAQ